MFVDRVRIWARGGKGGDGCCAFRREKFIPRGGPNGGDGGKGGDVVLEVDPHLNNLLHLRLSPHHFADKGQNGKGSQRTGRTGKDHVIKVPPGTVVMVIPTTLENFERSGDLSLATQVIDLIEPGQRHVLCAGGRGGRGNQCFKSSVNQAPRRTEPGFPGEQGQFFFVLKSIADVGLVGFPNAGKSSLLAALSAARPKIAPYPFTTLEPMIGVVEVDLAHRFTLADIPGLIEGAHLGVGLGLDFLRHIERCRVLAHIIDMGATEGRDPVADYRAVRKELKNYDPALAARPHILVANKMDVPGADEQLKLFRRKVRHAIFPVSASTGTGLPALRGALDEALRPSS
ncbi:MAG: GTPase ObgE [Candidatus Methylacidiphilales bacterium]|nr:GTPase ObgE [Candidatus Methylacidiphilales bacterium]